MSRDNTVELVFRADTSAAEGSIRTLGGTIDTSMGGIRSTAEQTGSALRSNFQIDPATIVAGFAGIGAGIKTALDASIEFEDAMSNVKKTVDFDTPDGLKNLGDTILEMSREIPISAEGLAGIAAAAGQLGVEAEAIPDFTASVAKMATAFDLLPEQAGTAMAKLSNVLGIPVVEIEGLGDTINALSNTTTASASDIVDALLRIGGSSTQFGLSAEQASALATAFIDLGKAPETASTAINTLLNKLQTADKQGGKFQEALASLGLEASDLQKSIGEDAQGALNGFLQKLAEVDDQTRAGMLTDLFGVEFADDIGTLVGSLGKYESAVATASDKVANAGSVQREYEDKIDTTKAKMELLDNQFHELGAVLGDKLKPAFEAVLGVLSDAVTSFTNLARESPNLALALGGVATALGAMAAYKATSSVFESLLGSFRALPETVSAAANAITDNCGSTDCIEDGAAAAADSLEDLLEGMGKTGKGSSSLASKFGGIVTALTSPTGLRWPQQRWLENWPIWAAPCGAPKRQKPPSRMPPPAPQPPSMRWPGPRLTLPPSWMAWPMERKK